MEDRTSDLERLRWNHIDLAIVAVNHISTLEMYRDEVARPSLRLLDEKIECYAQSDDPVAIFSHDDFADLRSSTIEGFFVDDPSYVGTRHTRDDNWRGGTAKGER